MDVRMVEAAFSDLPAVGRILVESWREAYKGIVPDDYLKALSPKAREERMRGQWNAGRRLPMLILRVDGVAAGLCCYGKGISRDVPPAWGELGACYLLPAYWGRGLGSLMIQRVDEELRAMGCEKSALWVFEENARARRAYERAGYKADGERGAKEYGGRQVPSVRMSKDL